VAGIGPTIARVQFHDDELSLVFQVISDATGWSIFPGAKVTGKVTIYARDIAAGDLLETAVRMAGFVYVKRGGIVSVMTYEDYMLYYGVVKRTFTLRHREAGQVAAVLTPFVTVRGKLIPDPESRVLVVR
jgi:type II secretory pathway component GspD/PulD (secretin)